MMIDSHVHTGYSKHAAGSVDDVVNAALAAGVKVLTITDHAPFHIDSTNRLLDSELDRYFTDIHKAQTAYRGDIKILSGLECDYMPGCAEQAARLLARYDLDFVMASIHYIPTPEDGLINGWDLPRLIRSVVLESYFSTLAELLECGLFDAVGHADALLRGVPEEIVCHYMEPLLGAFARSKVAFELNASGLRKTVLDPNSGREERGRQSYPSRSLLPRLIGAGAAFTIGSDAHAPEDVGVGVQALIHALLPLGLNAISYFENRRRVDIDAASLLSPQAL